MENSKSTVKSVRIFFKIIEHFQTSFFLFFILFVCLFVCLFVHYSGFGLGKTCTEWLAVYQPSPVFMNAMQVKTKLDEKVEKEAEEDEQEIKKKERKTDIPPGPHPPPPPKKKKAPTSNKQTKRERDLGAGNCSVVQGQLLIFTINCRLNSRGVEEAGCKIYSGTPTVSQTTG